MQNTLKIPCLVEKIYRYFDSYIKQNNFNSIYGNEAIRKFSRYISFSLRQHNDKKSKLHVVGLNILIKPRSCSELNENLEIKHETGIFIKVGCIKTNETPGKKLLPRWKGWDEFCVGFYCVNVHTLKVLCLCPGSAIQVLKEWNMTGKKKVRFTWIVNG